MDINEFLEKIKGLPEEEKKRLIEEIRGILKVPRKREIPQEAKELVEEYNRLKARITEIRRELKEKYGLMPTGITVRRGYGNYDYRGTPAYNTVKEILSKRITLTIGELEEELKNRGYKGLTGTIMVVLKNLKEDGLIVREGEFIKWQGST